MNGRIPVVVIDGGWGLTNDFVKQIAESFSKAAVIEQPRIYDSPDCFEPEKDLELEERKYKKYLKICKQPDKPEIIIVFRSWMGYLAGYYGRSKMGCERSCWGLQTTMICKEEYWKANARVLIVPDAIIFANSCIDSDVYGGDECEDHLTFEWSAKYLLEEGGYKVEGHSTQVVIVNPGYYELQTEIVEAIKALYEKNTSLEAALSPAK